MSIYPYSIKILGSQDRTNFSCGVDVLDNYFYRQVSQDVKRRVAGCNILIDNSNNNIAGFYTLSACHINLDNLSEQYRKKLPRYPNVPAVRLGRLAVDKKYQGHKLASVLLFDAIERSLKSDVVAHMMIVDAKDKKAVTFYEHHGFMQDKDNPLRLFASLDNLSNMLGIK